MNGKQYDVVLSALADKIIEKDKTILLQQWEIEDLKQKLTEAEKHLKPTEANGIKLEIR